MTKKRNKFLKWIAKRYQLFLYHGKSYDVIWKIRFNRLSIISLCALAVLSLFFISYSIIAYTSIKETIPDFPTKEIKNLIYENAIRTDSLVSEIEQRDLYLKMLQDLIFNEIPIDQDFVVPTQHLTEKQIKEFNNPALPRRKLDTNTQYAVSGKEEVPKLFPPIKGIVVASFDRSNEHYGTDIASSGETTIYSILSGTVIVADYTVKNGYTIMIQHTSSDLLSVYKHNKNILVSAGQYVETGQAIAVYGNTGEYTSGGHLHFELWKKGVPLDAEKYINFE